MRVWLEDRDHKQNQYVALVVKHVSMADNLVMRLNRTHKVYFGETKDSMENWIEEIVLREPPRKMIFLINVTETTVKLRKVCVNK